MRMVVIGMLALAGCGEPAAASDGGFAAAMRTSAAPLAAAGAAAGASAGASGATKTVEVVDRLGFPQPIVATRLSVPADWRIEGGVNWDDSTPCASNRMKFMWRAVAPDGISAFEMMPGYSWGSPAAYVQMNPCPVAQIGSAQELLMGAARMMRPGAQILGYRRRDDLVQQARGTDRPGGHTDVGELRLRYAVGGTPVEEVLYVQVLLGDGGGGTAGYILGWRAPAGKLDTAAFDRLRGTFQPNRQYLSAIGQRGMQAINAHAAQQSAAISAWHNRRMAEINAKGASDRAAIRARGNAETNAIYADTYAGTQASNDRMYDSNLRALKEEQTWTNPSTGQVVQGSIHGGSRVLEQSDGSFARTDDPYYNPPGSTEYEPQ